MLTSDKEQRILAAIIEQIPNCKTDKGPVQAAITGAAELLDDSEEIKHIYPFRISPHKTRGFGLTILTNDSLIFADSHPPSFRINQKIQLEEIHSIVSGRINNLILAVAITSTKPEIQIVSEGRTRQFLDDLRELVPEHFEAEVESDFVNWWDDPSISWPRGLSVDNDWEYLGGDQSRPPCEGVVLQMSRSGIVATRSVAEFRLEIKWPDVKEVHVEGSQQAQSRVTVKRMLLVGLFAFAWKKKLSSGFLVVIKNDGSEVIFSSSKTEPQLRALLSHVLVSARAASESTAEPKGVVLGTADRMRELKTLLDEGLISETEFEEKRRALLAEI